MCEAFCQSCNCERTTGRIVARGTHYNFVSTRLSTIRRRVPNTTHAHRTRSNFQVFLRTCSLPDFILFHFCCRQRHRRQCSDRRFFLLFQFVFLFSCHSPISIGSCVARVFHFFSFLSTFFSIDCAMEWAKHSSKYDLDVCTVCLASEEVNENEWNWFDRPVGTTVVVAKKVCRNWLAISLWQIIYVATTCTMATTTPAVDRRKWPGRKIEKKIKKTNGSRMNWCVVFEFPENSCIRYVSGWDLIMVEKSYRNEQSHDMFVDCWEGFWSMYFEIYAKFWRFHRHSRAIRPSTTAFNVH